MTVKERPILFSTQMVQAILANRKTQTRRVIKPQPHNVLLRPENSFVGRVEKNLVDGLQYGNEVFPALCPFGDIGDRHPTSFGTSSPPSNGFYWVRWEPNDTEEKLVWLTRVPDEPQDDPVDHDVERWVWGKDQTDDPESICDVVNPLDITWRKPSDRLWVRETWTTYERLSTQEYSYLYKADFNHPTEDKWKPSIHMPRKACRILLEITDIRIERLQDISEEDAIAEGVESRIGFAQMTWYKDYLTKVLNGDFLGFDSAIKSFQSLWDSINGKTYPWESNPWVWVIEFKRVY